MDKIYNKSNKIMKDLNAEYAISLRRIRVAVAEGYVKMLEYGGVSNAAYYQSGAFVLIDSIVKEEVNRLASIEKTIVGSGFKEIYISAIDETSKIYKIQLDLQQFDIENALNKRWVGRNWSDSIWSNKNKLYQKLKASIGSVIMNGDSKDKAVAAIKESMDVGFTEADRLVRTETMQLINSAQLKTYATGGIVKYRYLAALDERTSTICQTLNGKEFLLKDAELGVNFPPMHPNCRSTIVPVIE